MKKSTMRPIPDFESYAVDVDGIVYSQSGKPLKVHPSKRGYLLVQLWKNAKRRSTRVHVLVLEAFVGPRPAGMEACHIDGNPANNQLSNLRWDTRSNNAKDRFVHGTHNFLKR